MKGTTFVSEFISELEELFCDPITSQVFIRPKLIGQHTFCQQTVNQLIKTCSQPQIKYIIHPFTREKFYLTTIKDLPDNDIVSDLLEIFIYCRKKKINEQNIKQIIGYFVRIFSICYDLNYDRRIQNITFMKIAEMVGIDKTELNQLYSDSVSTAIDTINLCLPNSLHLNGILFRAVKSDRKNLINVILLNDFHIDLNIKDRHNKTLFFWACYNNNISLAKLLVNLGADVYIKDYLGNNPFLWAYKYNHIQTISFAQNLCDNINLSKKNKRLLWAKDKHVQINTKKLFNQSKNNFLTDNWQTVKNKTRNKLKYSI